MSESLSKLVAADGIRISVTGINLDVRSDGPLSKEQLAFLTQNKAKLLSELAQERQNTYMKQPQSVEIDAQAVVSRLAEECGVSASWINQIVIDGCDVDCIKKGLLSTECLKAHIEYHIAEQQRWREFKKHLHGGDAS